jgi:hypothetical protein
MTSPKWIKRRAENLFDNALFAIVSIAGVSIASTLGLTRIIDGPSAVITGLFIFACLAVAWNQLAQILARHARNQSGRLAPSDIEKQIWDWLKRYGFKLVEVPNPGCDFSLTAELEGRPPAVTIVKLSTNPWVTILTNVGFEDDRRALVRKRAPLIHKDVGIALVQLGVEHDMEFDGQGCLSKVQIRTLMPFDFRTTDLELLTAMRNVRGGALIAAEMLNRIVEEAEIRARSG